MNSAIFLSARDKSTRLPKKLFLPIHGRPIIDYLIDRLKTAKMPSNLVLCTSTHPDDISLVETAKRNYIHYFRGSPEDKLDRYLQAAEQFNINFMIIVDGDDVFCDPEHIDKIIETFKRTGADYITTKNLPLGTAAHGINIPALKKVCQLKDEVDTEVWGEYFTETGLFNVLYLKPEDPFLCRPDIRMTLDYPEDFKFFEAIFDRLSHNSRIFTLKEIILLIEQEPWIKDINTHVQMIYEMHLKKAAPIRMKL